MRFLAVFLAFFSFSASASEGDDYTFVYSGRTITARIEPGSDGFLINDVCARNEAHCGALAAYRKGPPATTRAKGLHAPCSRWQATDLYLRHHGSDADFCVFPDFTMVEARALFKRAKK